MSVRERRDLCPGAWRPWPAKDGLLVRLRLVGGHVTSPQLRALAEAAVGYGDGRVYVTSRANLQVRGLPGANGQVDPSVLAALEASTLLPHRSHELIRNIMISPQSGLASGLADLRPLGAELDRLLCANPRLADLPGRFLFVLDDGRGDLLNRQCDLGLVALDAATAQLRVGHTWGRVVALDDAAAALADLADLFERTRGAGPSAAWHVRELDVPLVPAQSPHLAIPEPSGPMAYGEVPGGRHVAVSDAGLGLEDVAALTAEATHLIVTPWRGILIPQGAS